MCIIYKWAHKYMNLYCLSSTSETETRLLTASVYVSVWVWVIEWQIRGIQKSDDSYFSDIFEYAKFE